MTPRTGPQRSEDEPAQCDSSAKRKSDSAVAGASDTARKRTTTPLCFEQLMLPSFCAANGDASDGQLDPEACA